MYHPPELSIGHARQLRESCPLPGYRLTSAGRIYPQSSVSRHDPDSDAMGGATSEIPRMCHLHSWNDGADRRSLRQSM